MATNPFSIKTGKLRLQLNRKEDIFHAEDVSSTDVLPVYENLIGIPKIGFGHGNFYASGVKLEKTKVVIHKQDTIIGGFYEDTVTQEFSPYEVNIYITYEIEE
jgi:hypothetical protein